MTATPTTAAPLAASASASASDGRNEELVRAALRDLQDLQSGPDAAAAIFARLAPGFRLRANGVAYDAPGFVAMWLGRKASRWGWLLWLLASAPPASPRSAAAQSGNPRPPTNPPLLNPNPTPASPDSPLPAPPGPAGGDSV